MESDKPKLCINCTYAKIPQGAFADSDVRCFSPALPRSLVTGAINPALCASQRMISSRTGYCGVEGIWYQERKGGLDRPPGL